MKATTKRQNKVLGVSCPSLRKYRILRSRVDVLKGKLQMKSEKYISVYDVVIAAMEALERKHR